MIITCFLFEDILTNRSFFFQPSGSSKSASTDSKTKRGPGRLLKDGVKYHIESIKPSGEPLTPKNIANKWTRQCGVLVKDQLPISIQEWKEPKTKRPDVTWVDDRAKQKLWESLMEHFTLPDYFTDADVQKVKDAALKKMAIAFNTHKKTVWANYLAAERKTPEFKGTLEKQREHWPAFVKFKESELSKERSRKNKANAAKKTQFHRLGPGGYAVAMPKWDKSEQEMEDAGVTPVTRSWPPRCRTWFYAHGGRWTRRQAWFRRRQV